MRDLENNIKKSALGAIELLKCLRNDNIDVQLLLLGTIQERYVYEEIISHKSDDIVVVTDDVFTVNASRLIGIGDIVVGTGRGAMEAALQGKVLLSPVEDLPTPVLVTPGNIETFLHYNFSDRTEGDFVLNGSSEYEKN